MACLVIARTRLGMSFTFQRVWRLIFMSKERDALKKAIGIINFTHPNTWHEFISEVEELLAQPEPTAEPVAWMWDEMFCEDWTTVSSVIKPSKSKYVDNVRPLYLTPPKREPLSEKEIREGNQSMLNATRETFIAGVRFAEVMHGITGGGECVAT